MTDEQKEAWHIKEQMRYIIIARNYWCRRFPKAWFFVLHKWMDYSTPEMNRILMSKVLDLQP